MLALLLAAGCSRSAPTFASGPAPLPAAPSGRVAANRLPPPPPPPPPGATASADTSELNADGSPKDANADAQDTEVASLGSGSETTPNSGSSGGGGGPLSRTSVLGAYKVTTTGGNCQIILSLTKWTGGYRAASRGCPGAVADVSAWDVSGNQVVLKDSGGSNVASLNSSGGSRYEGQTNGGQQISLYR